MSTGRAPGRSGKTDTRCVWRRCIRYWHRYRHVGVSKSPRPTSFGGLWAQNLRGIVRNTPPWIVYCLLKYTENTTGARYLPGSSTRMYGVLLIADAGRVGRRVVGACPGDGGVRDCPRDGRGDGSLRDAACDFWASPPVWYETRRSSGIGMDGTGLYDCKLKSADRGDVDRDRTPSLSLSDPPNVVGCTLKPGDGGTFSDMSTAGSYGLCLPFISA